MSVLGYKYQSYALQHEKEVLEIECEPITNTSKLYAHYLQVLPVQLFISLRPSGRRAMEYLKGVTTDFVDSTERTFKAPLSYCVSYEQYPYPNIHMLIASAVQLDAGWLRNCFKWGFPSTITNPDTGEVRSCIRHFYVDADVQPVDIGNNEGVTAYILKEMNRFAEAEFDVINLDYYLKEPVNRKDRKRLARHFERLERLKQNRK